MRVRFTAWHAYPLFDGSDPACVGGAETRAWLLATGLAQRPEFDVQFVVRTPQRFDYRRLGDVTVWNIADWLDGVRANVTRSVSFTDGTRRPRLQRRDPRLLWQLPLLAAARVIRGPRPAPETPAEVYSRQVEVECCFGVSAQSAAVVTAASRAGTPSILFLASNSDLDERFTVGSTYVTVHGERGDVCRRAIDGATRIVAQNEEQQRLLQERFGRDSVVFPSLIDLAAWDRWAARPNSFSRSLSGERVALWVGRADDFHKRPRLCIELARKLPRVHFMMILNPGDERVEREVRAACRDGVVIHPSVPFDQMPALLSASAVYVSTGSAAYEGSPNLFVQAAASGIPIASLEVRTPLIDGTGAGFVADGDLDRLAEYIATMVAEPGTARAAGEAGRRIVEREHTQTAVVDRLVELLRKSTPAAASSRGAE